LQGIGIELDFSADDQSVLNEFVSVFGGLEESTPPKAHFAVTVEAGGQGPYGSLTISGHDLNDPAAFLLGFASPTVPMVSLPSIGKTQRIGMLGDPEPLFLFDSVGCRFRKVSRWQRIVAHVIFLHVLHLRQDLLFFHAASVAINGRGILLVGPKGSGKSTLSLALAARGHAFLGDETAAYRRADGKLLPMLRPVGIKPGPRSQRLDERFDALMPSADADNMLRIPVSALLPETRADAVPLSAIIFLTGFGQEPSLLELSAGREELAAMQPLRSSTSETNSMQCVFEMVRMLASARCYRLESGSPDATAQSIEEKLSNVADSQ
jgi:hypothetical protein